MQNPCPACGCASPGTRWICHTCGAALFQPADRAEETACLAEFHQALEAALAASANPVEAAWIEDRFLRQGFLPHDQELLLFESEKCSKMISGFGDFGEGAGARFQACMLRLEHDAIARATATEPLSQSARIRRRQWFGRQMLGAPVHFALLLLQTLLRILVFCAGLTLYRKIRGLRAGRKKLI